MPRSNRNQTLSEQLARGPVDLPFLLLTVLLTVIGLIMVLSASSPGAYYDAKGTGNNPAYYFIRQGIFAAAGLVAMYIISKMNYQTFRWISIFVLGVSIILLILVFIPGIGVVRNGARRWIELGPIQFQPSETAKVGIVLYFASRLSKRDGYVFKPKAESGVLERFYNWLGRIGFLELVPYGVVLVMVCGLMALQPHLSGIIIIMVIAASILFSGGIQLRWFVFVGILVGIALTFYILSNPYMMERITSSNDPWQDPRVSGYQLTQSLMAIGSGGLTGVGLGKSRQKFMFLPEEHNDFIFSIICEELGLVGACVIIILFMLLFLRGYWIALHARDRFGSLLIVGVISQLAVQVFFNIGVVTGLLPTTGISLPLFSYGGTALMVQLAEMGIVLSVSRQVPPRRNAE
jgi:cell division protein FtsW